MARKDWVYVNFPVEQGEALDYIVSKEGKKYGTLDKHQLVRCIVADFIEKYETYKNIVIARKAVRAPNGEDLQQPIS